MSQHRNSVRKLEKPYKKLMMVSGAIIFNSLSFKNFYNYYMKKFLNLKLKFFVLVFS